MRRRILIVGIIGILIGAGLTPVVNAYFLKAKTTNKNLGHEQITTDKIGDNIKDVVIWDNYTKAKGKIGGSPFLPCIVTVKVVVDEEYRLHHPQWRGTTTNTIKNSVLRIGTLKVDCFLKYGIILLPLVLTQWKSDNTKGIMGLFYDVLKLPLSGCDILVALTGQCSPPGIVGVAAPGHYRCINVDMNSDSGPLTPHSQMLTDNLIQHEVSHLFGVHGDHPPSSNIKCVMSHGHGLNHDKWCPTCAAELIRGKARF